jgi:hypothetical protein
LPPAPAAALLPALAPAPARAALPALARVPAPLPPLVAAVAGWVIGAPLPPMAAGALVPAALAAPMPLPALAIGDSAVLALGASLEHAANQRGMSTAPAGTRHTFNASRRRT